MITIPHNKLSIVHHWCNVNISRRQYYLHNAFGGDGWEVKAKNGNWVLKTNDPKYETYIELKFK